MSEDGTAPKKRQGERNVGASLQQKLRNYAKETNDDVSLVLIRYINERFLYRLSVSPHSDQFVLRGATLFTLWNAEPHRSTRDIDLLAMGDSSPEAVRAILASVCLQSVPEDGVSFLPDTIRLEERAEGRVYQGLHAELTATLATARLRLEIDIAFGEAVVPPPVKADLPVLLSMPSPRLRVYPQETAIAEKCAALVSLGIPNTRMKDFYDLWHISRTHSFDGTLLWRAIAATFARRTIPYPADGLPVALTREFIEDRTKQQQWTAFVNKMRLTEQAAAFPALILGVRAFLQPPLEALAAGEPFEFAWSPDAGWGAKAISPPQP